MDHITAESRVATGKSLMVVAGDWMYKELEKDYSEYYGNVLPIKWPVISALGVKLGLCGASHAAGDECSACNVKLREIVKAVDEGKTDAEIVSALGATEAAVKAIREARCQYMLGEGLVVASVPAYSDAKKGAKLFLRFMYSDEGMRIFRSKTYVDLPASYTVEPEQSQYEFVQKMFERDKANDVFVRDSYLHSPDPPFGRYRISETAVDRRAVHSAQLHPFARLAQRGIYVAGNLRRKHFVGKE